MTKEVDVKNSVPQVAGQTAQTIKRPPQVPYRRLLKGIPVEPGQTLQDVHPRVIKEWFTGIETRWKAQYNSRAVDGVNANMSWTRG